MKQERLELFTKSFVDTVSKDETILMKHFFLVTSLAVNPLFNAVWFVIRLTIKVSRDENIRHA